MPAARARRGNRVLGIECCGGVGEAGGPAFLSVAVINTPAKSALEEERLC